MYFLLGSSVFLMTMHAAIVVAIGVRVVMRRSVRGVALSWLLLVATLPFAGALLYLLIGERRIGRKRSRAITALRTDFRQIARATIPSDFTTIDWSNLPATAQAMDRLGRSLVGFATVRGNTFELFTDTKAILAAIVRDVDAARTSVLMEFYIWNEGGAADEVLEAVIRAAARGVRCLLLIDALGARPWWKGTQPKRLRNAGVQLRAALPTGLLRTVVGRTDLRLHRKIVVIDGMAAWTGSMNLVDPRYFKQESGVGEWVDAMVRFDPFPYARLLLEVAGIDKIHASRPCRHTVDHHDLAVQAKVGTADQGAQQSDRKRCTKLNTGVAQALRLCALPPRPRPKRVDQQQAPHAASGRANDRFANFVRRTAFVPDVELHQHAGSCGIDVADDRRKNRLGVGEEFKSVAANGSETD